MPELTHSPVQPEHADSIELQRQLAEAKAEIAKLRESGQANARLRAMADAAPILLWETDQGGVTFVNQHYLDFFGASFDQIRAMGWSDFLHPDDIEGYVSTYLEGFTTRQGYAYECRFRRADGVYRWMRNTGAPVGVDRFAGGTVDITDLLEAQSALKQSEERLILEGVRNHAILTTDPTGTIASWSAGAQAIFGWSPEEVIGQSAGIIFTPEDRTAGTPARELATAEQEGCANDERWHVTKNGARVFMNGSVHPLQRDPQGRARGFIKIARDETQRREIEAALRSSEAVARENSHRLQLVVAAGAIIGTWHWDLPADRFTVDDAFATAFGLDPALGREGIPLAQIVATVHPDDQAGLAAAINEAIGRGGAYAHQYRVRRADGNYYWLEANGRVDHGPDGTPLSFPGVLLDVHERRTVEEERNRATVALRERETRLRLAVEAGRIGEWELDLATNTSFRALRHDQIFGYDAPIQDWGLDTFLSHVLPEDRAATQAAFTQAAETGAGWNFQCRIRRVSDNAVRWIAANSTPQLDDAGQTVKLFGVVQDITDQKTAELGLREHNQNLEQQVAERTAKLRLFGDIIQSSVAPICAFDKGYRLIAFNQAQSDEFSRVFGSRLQLGQVLSDQIPPDQSLILRGLMDRALAGEAFAVDEAFGDPAIIKPYWELTYAPLRDQSGQIIGAFHYARDITDRLRGEDELAAVQEALRQSQKMEAVGQLTGGLAHDFNNLLAGISGSLELMQTRMQQGRFNDVERYMGAAQGAAKRAAALTHRLLAFSRRQTLAPKPTDVARLAMGMQEMIQRTVGPGIPIEVVGAAGSWPALVDPSQLENALLNLCINARDAMPDGGKITVETANKWMDERAARQHSVPEGQYLSLSVTDTGTGMPPEVIARVFEPFFTTKPIGEGTGLGLSMIYGFAQQSGGQVRIYSEVGQGTTVCIYLPRHYGDVASDESHEKAADLPRSQEGETVLIVDDEPTVRMLITDILEDLGYAAIEAGDSATGLKVLQSDVRIDLLVTDVGLPGGMNGRQMADAARVTRPELKVLFITGYAENALLGNGHLKPGMAVLTKPFAMDDMAARIRSMIEAGKEAATGHKR